MGKNIQLFFKKKNLGFYFFSIEIEYLQLKFMPPLLTHMNTSKNKEQMYFSIFHLFFLLTCTFSYNFVILSFSFLLILRLVGTVVLFLFW